MHWLHKLKSNDKQAMTLIVSSVCSFFRVLMDVDIPRLPSPAVALVPRMCGVGGLFMSGNAGDSFEALGRNVHYFTGIGRCHIL